MDPHPMTAGAPLCALPDGASDKVTLACLRQSYRKTFSVIPRMSLKELRLSRGKLQREVNAHARSGSSAFAPRLEKKMHNHTVSAIDQYIAALGGNMLLTFMLRDGRGFVLSRAPRGAEPRQREDRAAPPLPPAFRASVREAGKRLGALPRDMRESVLARLADIAQEKREVQELGCRLDAMVQEPGRVARIFWPETACLREIRACAGFGKRRALPARGRVLGDRLNHAENSRVDNLKLGTLARYAQAIGADLQVVAVFDDRPDVIVTGLAGNGGAPPGIHPGAALPYVPPLSAASLEDIVRAVPERDMGEMLALAGALAGTGAQAPSPQALTLRELRQSRGLTQKDLAARISSEQDIVSRTENPRVSMKVNRLGEYIRGLGGTLRLLAVFDDGREVPVRRRLSRAFGKAAQDAGGMTLRDLRLAVGLTMQEVAARRGLTQYAAESYEQQGSDPRIAKLAAHFTALGVRLKLEAVFDAPCPPVVIRGVYGVEDDASPSAPAAQGLKMAG